MAGQHPGPGMTGGGLNLQVGRDDRPIAGGALQTGEVLQDRLVCRSGRPDEAYRQTASIVWSLPSRSASVEIKRDSAPGARTQPPQLADEKGLIVRIIQTDPLHRPTQVVAVDDVWQVVSPRRGCVGDAIQRGMILKGAGARGNFVFTSPVL